MWFWKRRSGSRSSFLSVLFSLNPYVIFDSNSLFCVLVSKYSLVNSDPNQARFGYKQSKNTAAVMRRSSEAGRGTFRG